jgi:hypothetical protein
MNAIPVYNKIEKGQPGHVVKIDNEAVFSAYPGPVTTIQSLKKAQTQVFEAWLNTRTPAHCSTRNQPQMGG